MKAQIESISPVKTKLFVEISPDEVKSEEAKAYRDLQRTATVPGFRKGKAPVDVLRRIYGGRVKGDVISKLVWKTYSEALEERDIHPVADADIELQDTGSEGGVAYSAVVEVRPKVVPRGYDGLQLKKEQVDVSEPEVEARLEALRRERATLEPAPEGHTAGEGDLVVMDYEGAVDGEPFEGGTGQDRSVVIGSGLLVPGFEEGLKGIAAGEERTVEVDFPADYRAEELAGKHAQFKVRVKEVKVRRLPELDDEFASEAAQVENLEGLRQKIREVIEAEKRSRAEREFRDRVIDAALQANPFEVPETLVARQKAHAMESLRQDLAQRGLDLETVGLDRGELNESYHRGAERSVRWAFLLNAIAEAEGIQVTEEDVDERIRSIAEADGRPVAVIRGFFERDDQMDSLRSALKEKKVIDRIVESAQVELASREVIEGGAPADE